MKATLAKSQENAKNMANEKETVSCYSVVGTYNGELRDLVTCRVYMGRSSSSTTVYASIWVYGKCYTSGHGSAGGYGYDKKSSAIGSAIRSAGIELWGNQYAHDGKVFDYETKQYVKENTKVKARIDGVGDSAIESALRAIGKMAGLRGKILVINH